ncbi:rubredoxin [Pseudomonas sp. A3.4]|nr:rubredoxin [Atopomonas sediminilitoris]MCJ8168702.1 rubredoxin [Atopomonas sediminilitoris]
MRGYQCPDCGYVYDEQRGEPHEGYAAGTLWADLPESFTCPDCAVREKADFIELSEQPS